MRKLIWTTSMSLDGYMEGADREIDWHLVDDELFRHQIDWLGRAGGFLEGRITYQLMEAYWPGAAEDPEAPPMTVEFGRIWRDTPKLVYSRTLERAGANATVVPEVVADEIIALKAEPGGDLVLGGADVAAEFIRRDLIDEYRVYVHPIVIGRGNQALRPSDVTLPLLLIETRTFGNGVVMLRYERRRSAPAGA